jgi:hypothetical protein
MKESELDNELRHITQMELEAKLLKAEADKERAQADEKVIHILENLDNHLKSYEIGRSSQGRH